MLLLRLFVVRVAAFIRGLLFARNVGCCGCSLLVVFVAVVSLRSSFVVCAWLLFVYFFCWSLVAVVTACWSLACVVVDVCLRLVAIACC